MPKTQELPRENWQNFLTALSNREKDHPVRITLAGIDWGAQPLAECLPLVGISLEMKGSERDAIEITAGGKDVGTANVTHMIEHPTHIYVEEENGMVRCLDIEDNQKVKTLIFFEEGEKVR